MPAFYSAANILDIMGIPSPINKYISLMLEKRNLLKTNISSISRDDKVFSAIM